MSHKNALILSPFSQRNNVRDNHLSHRDQTATGNFKVSAGPVFWSCITYHL